MRKVVILLFSAALPLLMHAQNENGDDNQNFSFGIDLGLNITRLNSAYIERFSEELDLHYAVKPSIGIYAKQRIIPKLYVKGSAMYARKGSTSYNPTVRLVNSYVDLAVMPQVQVFNDVYIHAGFSYSHLLTAKRHLLNGSSNSGFKSVDTYGFESEKNIVTGIEVKLQRNVNMEFNYYIPLNQQASQNFKLGINILLNSKKPSKPSVRKSDHIRSNRQIEDLRKGTLLVRLNTSQPAINDMKVVGYHKAANELEAQQVADNKSIIAAFKNHYSFSDIAFFYSSNSGQIKNKDYENIFLDDSLMIDTSVKIKTGSPVFIADFGPIEQDTARYVSSLRYDENVPWSVVNVKQYYGSPNFGFQALIIKDENFVQLKDPFPYYVRTIYESMRKRPEQGVFLLPLLPFQNWSAEAAVNELNTKLEKYLEKSRK